MARSLRGQLLAWLLPVAGLALVLGTLSVYGIVGQATEESLDQGLYDAAVLAADWLRSQDRIGMEELPPPAQRVLLAMPEDRVFFSLRDAAGKRLGGDGHFADDRPWGSLEAPAYFDLNHGGYWLRAISVVFEAGGRAVHLTLATTAQKREKLMDRILLAMVGPQLLLFLVTIALVWSGIRHGLAPLETLRQDIALRSDRDLRPLDAGRAPEELQPIIGEFNALLVRLDQALSSQKQFVADAAHQLRTPIAGLLAQLEAGGVERNNALLSTTRRLARLVGQLLALSRAEPGMAAESKDYDLAELIREAANDWLPQAFRQDMDVRFDLAGCRLHGSPDAMREVLANLVDNAIRYGRQGGGIAVSCRVEGDEVVLHVDDDGPGVPPLQRERVFERFYRPPGTPGEGCGLGLPIVAALVRQQGGRIRLADAPDLGGLRAEVRLPLRRGSPV